MAKRRPHRSRCLEYGYPYGGFSYPDSYLGKICIKRRSSRGTVSCSGELRDLAKADIAEMRQSCRRMRGEYFLEVCAGMEEVAKEIEQALRKKQCSKVPARLATIHENHGQHSEMTQEQREAYSAINPDWE